MPLTCATSLALEQARGKGSDVPKIGGVVLPKEYSLVVACVAGGSPPLVVDVLICQVEVEGRREYARA